MSSFLEDIEFATKVNEEIKKAEQRGIENSMELTKEILKQQYEPLIKENKQLTSILIELEEYLQNHIEEWGNSEDEYMMGVIAEDKDILNKIQELKERYK